MAANGISSVGTKLFYKLSEEYVELLDVLEIPDLGGEVEAIEITNLSSTAHEYTDGLKNYGNSIAFKFNYVGAQFDTLNALEGVQEWKVTLPDGAACEFSGSCSVKLDGFGIGAAITYTLSIKPNSEMIWA